jgi:hypothetical protein
MPARKRALQTSRQWAINGNAFRAMPMGLKTAGRFSIRYSRILFREESIQGSGSRGQACSTEATILQRIQPVLRARDDWRIYLAYQTAVPAPELAPTSHPASQNTCPDVPGMQSVQRNHVRRNESGKIYFQRRRTVGKGRRTAQP